MKKKIICIVVSLAIIITSILAFHINTLAASGTSKDLTWTFDGTTGCITISGNGYGSGFSLVTSQPWYNYNDKVLSVVAEEGVKSIEENWFNGCSNLTTVSLPQSLEKIGNKAFASCKALEKIDIPSQCTNLYKSCFYMCTSLKEAVLPEDNLYTTYKHKIPDSFFYGCTSLETVYIGSGFTQPYSTSSFKNCSAIKNVYWGCKSLTYTLTNTFSSTNSINFYGARNSGMYAQVMSVRGSGDNWKYYCIDEAHEFSSDDSICSYCDMPNHKYSYSYEYDGKLYYTCADCKETDLKCEISNVMNNFCSKDSSNLSTKYDINRDGVNNAKDYAILNQMKNNNKTYYEVSLSNPNADGNAIRMYQYFCSMYGNGVITGQQESTWIDGPDYEMNYIYTNTGKYPAIRGLDFMNDDFSGVVSRSISWAKKGGIVSIDWHCSKNFDKSYDNCKSDTLTSDEWEKMLTPGTSEYKKAIAGMDKAANALLQLQQAGVTVLWRPFHEFDGGWFWWGKGGSDYFKRLWIMMYNHYTYDLGLNNLIWVLGYCHNGTDYGTNLADWYPGDQYCDIVGADSYEVSTNGGEARLYNPVKTVTRGIKPLALHETGTIPTEAQFKNVPWGYFLTWHTTYITNDNSVYSLNMLYNSDWAITLDELPWNVSK